MKGGGGGNLIVLLVSHTVQFPPTVKSDSGETKVTETSSQFSKRHSTTANSREPLNISST